MKISLTQILHDTYIYTYVSRYKNETRLNFYLYKLDIALYQVPGDLQRGVRGTSCLNVSDLFSRISPCALNYL